MIKHRSTTISGRSVLLLARDADYRGLIASVLHGHGFRVTQANDRIECARLLAAETFDVLVVDTQATGSLAIVPTDTKLPPLIALTSNPSDASIRLLQSRAAEVMMKPIVFDQLRDAVVAVIGGGRGTAKLHPTARSAAMRAVLDQVERLRQADCSVLILGETGTGKTYLARKIHEIGARASGPFVDLNCSALMGDRVESELFGHERGAFTGAHSVKQGLFDAAHGGTLFLDELGDVDLGVQPRILKVLEDKRFRRMGDVRERSVDVRLLAATNQDLLTSIVQKTFRADLYYRISTMKLTMPALRQRREDILALTHEMLQRLGSDAELSPSAEDKLLNYDWPGNLRELKNVVESATLLRRSAMVHADDIQLDGARRAAVALTTAPMTTRPMAPAPVTPVTTSSDLLAESAREATYEEIEQAHIKLALATERGRVGAAARRLGIPRSTLYWKLKRYSINPRDTFRQ